MDFPHRKGVTLLTRFIPLIGGEKTAENAAQAAASALLLSTHDGYYHHQPGRGIEECSSSLRALLGLDDFDNELEMVLGALTKDSRAALAQGIESLRAGEPPLRLLLHSRHDRVFLCFGSARLAAGDVLESLTLWFSDVSERERHAAQASEENTRLNAKVNGFRAVLDAAPFPVWRRGHDCAIAYCNPAYTAIVGQTADTAPGDDSLELDLHARAMARQALESGRPHTARRHLIVGGARTLYQITEIPLAGGQGLVGVAQDISEQEGIQEELKRHIAAQSDLLESSVSAMAVFGPDMRLRFFNQAYARLWRLEESFLETEPAYGEILESLREKRRLPEQANFPAFKQQQARLFTDLIERQEEFYYLPDGTSLRVVIIPHALGGLLFVYEDVTDRLALERSYNTLIAVQRATLDNLHEGVAVFAENGRLKLSNPVFLRLWGLTPEFAEDEPHLAQLLEQTRSLYVFDDWEAFKTDVSGMLHTRDLRFRRLERTDGSVIDWCCVPLPDGATLMTYYDITDSTLLERSLREKNEALQESDRLKTQFLANVSYELRSPLTSIIGFSEVLKQHYFGELNAKQQEYLEGIYDSSQQLMNLINDILDLACIEAGYMTIEISRFDIPAMLATVLSLIRERVRELGLQLDVQYPKKIGKMTGDETRIKQVLFHLLSNAIAFTPRGGQITLGAAEGGDDTVVFWVEDTGIGIPEEEQAGVFERFHRAGNVGPLRSGTGLGLSIVESFVQLHGGKVELHSTLEVGTKVVCTLPRGGPETPEA